MTTKTTFLKSLAAASANNISLSQSPGAGAILLNGATSTRLSTTTTAAVLAGATNLPLNSVAGLVAGQSVSDSTAPTAIATGTVIVAVGASNVMIWPPVGGPGVGSGDTIVLGGTATIDTLAATTNTALGRRVILTSGGNDTGINFTVTGTNGSGNVISDTFAGASGSAAQSNLDFVTVTAITASGAVAGTLTAGTNGVGSSPWVTMNQLGYPPMNIAALVELVSGAVNYTVEYTLDDPNALLAGSAVPLALSASSPAALIAASATKDGLFSFPLVALRTTINSGTGVIRTRFLQAGVG